jgi:hypothetical protein
MQHAAAQPEAPRSPLLACRAQLLSVQQWPPTMLRTRLPRSRRLFLVGLAAVGVVVALAVVGISRLRRGGDVRWWRGLSDFAPWPDADTADADVREEAARRLFNVVTRALKRSAVTYSVGGPTLFNCHVFRNLTSPMVRGDPHLHLDGLTSRGDVGRLYWCECVARVLPLHRLTSLTVDDVITSSLALTKSYELVALPGLSSHLQFFQQLRALFVR